MNTLEQKISDAIYDAEFEEIKHSAIYKMDFQKAAKACTEISIDFAKGFAEWKSKEHWRYNHPSNLWFKGVYDDFITTDELITKYIDTLK